MIHARLAASLALLSSLAVGCTGNGDDSDGTGGTDGDAKPFQGEWEVVVPDVPFPLDTVKTITIGRKEYMENFANRGDVEVYFDNPTETIKIEMRKYSFQLNQGEADEAFGRIHLWAYVSSGNPDQPSKMDPADDCSASWQDGCSVYVWYDGQSQPARTGADFRVHLPAAYRQKISIQTEDNITEFLYPIRGDITVSNLCGSGDFKLSSGVAKVHLCRELTPGPTCSAEDIAACETWQEDDGMGGMKPAPWAKTCPCSDFGSVKITALDPYAANMTVDAPSTVWTHAVLDNQRSGQTVAGDHCTATVDPNTCGAGCTLSQSPETPWKATVDLNFPGPSATMGAGYSINMVSSGCEAVPYVDGPSDFDPNASMQEKQEDRGNLTLCTGCLTL
ncbi:MAG: hypothetical protein R3B09_25075 [Nannocystaceae bacterium]